MAGPQRQNSPSRPTKWKETVRPPYFLSGFSRTAPYILGRLRAMGHGGTGDAPMSGGDVFFTPFFFVRLPSEQTGRDVLLRARVAAARRHPSAVHRRGSSDDSGCWREARIRLHSDRMRVPVQSLTQEIRPSDLLSFPLKTHYH